jgi:hypothetical protein
MRKHIFTLAIVTILTTSAFSQENKPKKESATVEQLQGVYVFVDSRPAAEYKFLGTSESGGGFLKSMGGASEYNEKKLKLIKIAVKEYPEADGVILHFVSHGMDKVDAIKFKD